MRRDLHICSLYSINQAFSHQFKKYTSLQKFQLISIGQPGGCFHATVIKTQCHLRSTSAPFSNAKNNPLTVAVLHWPSPHSPGTVQATLTSVTEEAARRFSDSWYSTSNINLLLEWYLSSRTGSILLCCFILCVVGAIIWVAKARRILGNGRHGCWLQFGCTLRLTFSCKEIYIFVLCTVNLKTYHHWNASIYTKKAFGRI